MLWWIVIFTSIGILLGLWLRVGSVLAASLLVAVVGTPLLILLTDWPLLTTVAFLFALLSALQCGYLAGAVIAAFSQRRAKSPVNAGLRPRLGRDDVSEPEQDRDERVSAY